MKHSSSKSENLLRYPLGGALRVMKVCWELAGRLEFGPGEMGRRLEGLSGRGKANWPPQTELSYRFCVMIRRLGFRFGCQINSQTEINKKQTLYPYY